MRIATVAICDACWRKEEPERMPVRMKEAEDEQCYRCNCMTRSGIYVRRRVERRLI